MADAVRIVEVPAVTATPSVVDNADAAYAETGSDWLGWSSSDNYGGGCRYAPPAGTGQNTARWTFSPPPVGTYQVYATWNAAGNHASNAAYTVLDGGTPLSTVYVDQQTPPDDLVADGQGWASLGVYAIHQGVLTVQISDSGANGYVVADAVRIDPVQVPVALNDSYTVAESTPQTVGPAQGLLANDNWDPSVMGWSFDLGNQCIVFPKPAGDTGQTAAAVRSLVLLGEGTDGLWNGTTGLYSSVAAAADADPDGPRMGIVYADAADLGLSPGDTYDGVTIPTYGAIIARYSYVGDSDLDGRIDHGEEGDPFLPALPDPRVAQPLTVTPATVQTPHGTVCVEEDGGFRWYPSDDYVGA